MLLYLQKSFLLQITVSQKVEHSDDTRKQKNFDQKQVVFILEFRFWFLIGFNNGFFASEGRIKQSREENPPAWPMFTPRCSRVLRNCCHYFCCYLLKQCMVSVEWNKSELLNVCSARSFYSHVFVQIPLPLLTIITVLTKDLLYSLTRGFDNMHPDDTEVLA